MIRLLRIADHCSFDRKFYDLHKAPFFPKPEQTQYPRIVIGGKGKKWIMPTVAVCRRVERPRWCERPASGVTSTSGSNKCYLPRMQTGTS